LKTSCAMGGSPIQGECIYLLLETRSERRVFLLGTVAICQIVPARAVLDFYSCAQAVMSVRLPPQLFAMQQPPPTDVVSRGTGPNVNE
jgi:hypothetical protein